MKLSELFEAKSSGKSTAYLGTTRASKGDITSALKFVSKHAGIPLKDLHANLVGSTQQTLAGKQADSGDIDVVVDSSAVSKDEIVQRMLDATAQEKIHHVGDGVYSFAVPVPGDRKVQVDLMISENPEWAKWAYHSSPDSSYKAAVRSLLFVNVMKQVFEPGKDLEIKEDDKPVLRVRRSFKAEVGLERLFKLAPMRKDGKGRTKNMGKVKPEVIQAELDRLGRDDKFSSDREVITDPDQAASLMFGKGVKAKDVMSVEQIVSLIKKRKDAATIFKNTLDDLQDQGLKLPPEIQDA